MGAPRAVLEELLRESLAPAVNTTIASQRQDTAEGVLRAVLPDVVDKVVLDVMPSLEEQLQTVKECPDWETQRRCLVVTPADDARIAAGMNSDLETLQGRAWLNDNIINSYLAMLPVPAISSFFFTALQRTPPEGMSRWTKKIDVMAQPLVFLPIHHKEHWTLVTIEPPTRTLTYYDSMGGDGEGVLDLLEPWVLHLEGTFEPQRTAWSRSTPDVPKQDNSDDCGVFVCAFANALAYKRPFDFVAGDTAYLRKRISIELLLGRIPLPY
eukprot:Sspe_Gene.48462::Locus_25259_Transcript_1_2_Confidence_0.667_Length_909::g.48462::m.48462/K08592/SENP1; sentrin-specific protease 1